MGHRAIVGNSIKDGKIEVYYSHWGAANTHSSKNPEKDDVEIKVPEETSEKRWKVKDEVAFGIEVDYLHHEAVWLNGKCYVTSWTYMSDLKPYVSDWKTEGRGILICADTIKEFNEIEDKIDKYKTKMEESGLNSLEAETKYIFWLLKNFKIPEFSPFVNLKDKKTIKSHLVAEEI